MDYRLRVIWVVERTVLQNDRGARAGGGSDDTRREDGIESASFISQDSHLRVLIVRILAVKGLIPGESSADEIGAGRDIDHHRVAVRARDGIARGVIQRSLEGGRVVGHAIAFGAICLDVNVSSDDVGIFCRTRESRRDRKNGGRRLAALYRKRTRRHRTRRWCWRWHWSRCGRRTGRWCRPSIAKPTRQSCTPSIRIHHHHVSHPRLGARRRLEHDELGIHLPEAACRNAADSHLRSLLEVRPVQGIQYRRIVRSHTAYHWNRSLSS